MLRDKDLQIVKGVIQAFRAGELDVSRDRDVIAHAVSIVRSNNDNPRLCSAVDPTHIEPGDSVCFIYERPDVNEPWRFGVVDKFNAGCWVTFTFNIRRKRKKTRNGTEQIVPDLPSYRQYDLRKMSRIRRVCRTAVQEPALAHAEDVTKLGEGVKQLFEQLFPHK